jgi:copper chaperone CopZ
MKTYAVTGMTCAHCVAAVTAEVSKVPDAGEIAVDLASGTLTVTGSPDDDLVREAVDEAGYDLA